MIFAFCIFSTRVFFFHFGREICTFPIANIAKKKKKRDRKATRCRRLCPLFWYDITVLIELNTIYS